MPRFSMIFTVDSQRQFITGEEISSQMDKLKSLLSQAQDIWVESLSIEGINAFMITQNGSKQLDKIIEMLEMFKNMSVSDVAKSMYLAIFKKIDVMDTPNHFGRVREAMRVNTLNDLRGKADRENLFHFEWQGFEFLF